MKDISVVAFARLAAKLSGRNDLSDEEAVRILLGVYNDCITFGVDCGKCARTISEAFGEHCAHVAERERWMFERFWLQIAVVAVLNALHSHDRLLAEVMPIVPPWENPRWWQS